MDQTLDEAVKEAEAGPEKWIDDYLSDKINASSFSVLVVLNRLERKLSGYRRYAELKAHIGLITGLVSGKHLTPKEEQRVKEKLREVMRIRSDDESGTAEKDQAVDGIVDKIEDLLLEIIGFVKE